MLHFTKVLMRLNHDRFISGQELADIHKVTRATIHNCIQKIDKLGIEIERVRGLGYRLIHPVDFLDKEIIHSHFPAQIQQMCSQLQCLDEIDSTNEFASSIGMPSSNKFYAVLAERQMAGRGRRGREWVSPYAANIYLSIVWPLQRPLHEAGILSPMLALNILKCLNQLGVPNLGLKWPNDIYCNERKLSGLLVECTGGITDTCKLVIGVGVNVAMSRVKHVEIDQQWTDISANVKDWSYSRNELSAQLITSLVDGVLLFEQHNTSDSVDEWMGWDITLNKHVIIYSEGNERSGIARGIDHNGCLLMETESGVEKISAGDVSLRVQS